MLQAVQVQQVLLKKTRLKTEKINNTSQSYANLEAVQTQVQLVVAEQTNIVAPVAA